MTEPGEECDDGSANDNVYGRCMENCKFPRCGDGVIHICLDSEGQPILPCQPDCDGNSSCVPEECDDANNVDGDGCSSDCLYEYVEVCETAVNGTKKRR